MTTALHIQWSMVAGAFGVVSTAYASWRVALARTLASTATAQASTIDAQSARIGVLEDSLRMRDATINTLQAQVAMLFRVLLASGMSIPPTPKES